MIQILKNTHNKISAFIKTTLANLLFVYKTRPRKALAYLLLWLLAFVFVIILSKGFSIDPQSQSTDNSSSIIQELIYSGSDNYFINQLKTGINASGVVYDNFISYTPDPTGRATCVVGSSWCSFSMHPSANIFFPSTNTQIKTTQDLTNLLINIVVPLGFILISMQALNLIVNGENASLKHLLIKSFGLLILMLLTPYILSLSILLCNQLTVLILDDNSLTGFLTAFIDGLESNTSGNAFQDLIMTFLELGNNGSINPLSYLYALPVIVSLGLVMLLLLFISFQFILRFLNLFFLATVYPAALIFGLHPATSGIVKNFWKQWTTFLIQQPVFVLGFVIMHKVLVNMFNEGVTLEALIIFIAMLVFLGSINILAARLWGDVYSAVSQNITSALAASELKSTLIDKPLSYAGKLSTWGNNLNNTPQNIFKSDFGNRDADNQKSNKTSKLFSDMDSGSLLTKELRGSGYSVIEKDRGKLQVSGDFFTDTKDKGNSGIAYTTAEDAIKDGVSPTSIERVRLNNVQIQDASNKKMLMRYNENIRNVAAANAGKAGDIGLSYKSNDSKVIKSMDIGRSHNLQNNIQGIGVRNDAISGDKSISGDNIIKLHLYRQVINNKK